MKICAEPPLSLSDLWTCFGCFYGHFFGHLFGRLTFERLTLSDI